MTPLIKSYLILLVAIFFEVMGTCLLPHSNNFRKPLLTSIIIICYVIAFYSISLVIRIIPVGIAYAIWAGSGIVLIAAINAYVLKQNIDIYATFGIGLIVLGVIVINVFSKSVSA